MFGAAITRRLRTSSDEIRGGFYARIEQGFGRTCGLRLAMTLPVAVSINAIPDGFTENGGAGDLRGGAAHLDHAFRTAERGMAGDDEIGRCRFVGCPQGLRLDNVEASAGEMT